MGSACLFCRNNSKTVKISLAPLCFLVHALIGLCQLPVTNRAAESVQAHGVQSCSDAALPQRGEALAHHVGVVQQLLGKPKMWIMKLSESQKIEKLT